MAGKEKFEAKLKSLRETLEAIGHVPMVTENRSVNANVKYYYKNYSDNPLVAELMRDFPLEIGKRGSYIKHDNVEERAANLERELSKYKRVPTSEEDKALLAEINYCYRTHPDKPAIKRLRKLYPTNALYSKWGPKVDKETHPDAFCMGGPGSYHGLLVGPLSYFENPFKRAKRYILECLEEFQELPGDNTWPMHFAFEDLDGNYRNGIPSNVIEFAEQLIREDVVSEDFKTRYYSSMLDHESLFCRISEIMGEFKICSLGFLAKHIMPGRIIDVESLYQFFYYQDQNNGYPSNGISKKHRHLYRLIDYQTETAGKIVSLGWNELRELDFNIIANTNPIEVVPKYSFEFSEEEEIHYAQAFLFHHDIKHDYINGVTTRIVNYSVSIFDDLGDGICPFRFINKYPYRDAPELTLDWCILLMNLDSPLLGEYIEKKSFFSSFSSLVNDVACPKAQRQIRELTEYLRTKYDYELLGDSN